MAWNLDPLVLVLLAALLAFASRARSRWAFMLAWASLVVAFLSPLCALTVALFSARAVHHLLLVVVAAPLMAVAFPWPRLGAGLSGVLTATALALWHVPAVYSFAWDQPAAYWLMQGALFVPAWAFFSAVLRGEDGGRSLISNAGSIAGLAGVMGLIGAVLVFATGVLYPQHLFTAPAFGLDPMTDQQLAGLIMWVPGFLPMAMLAAVVAQRAWRAEHAR